METTKDRLKEFLKSEGLSQRRFEIAVGVSNGYVNNLKSSPSSDVIQKIICNYPELNTTWLLTGEGQMLKSSTTQQVGNINGNAQGVNVNGSVSINEAVDKFLDEIAAQRRITEKCMEHIDRLIKLLEDKR